MDGVLIINKSRGFTSHDIVAKVKEITHEKVGHAGTLDPLATGVLPLLIGKGTLCSKYLINHDKTYIVTLKLGEKTETGDLEGKFIEKQKVNEQSLDEKNIQNVLKSFIGKQEQRPPMYSAIKVNGKKLYEYARKNESIKVEPRKIEIYSINLISVNKQEKEIIFKVKCSKGTYIRSLCEDIAVRLKTVGYMKQLNRITVGQFDIEQSILVDNLDENTISQKLIKIEDIFSNLKDIKLDTKKLKLFLNGVRLTVNLEDGIYKIYNEQSFIGIGIINKNLLKRDIVVI